MNSKDKWRRRSMDKGRGEERSACVDLLFLLTPPTFFSLPPVSLMPDN
jgi:hypothetical protein